MYHSGLEGKLNHTTERPIVLYETVCWIADNQQNSKFSIPEMS